MFKKKGALLEYNYWANKRSLASIKKLTENNEQPLKIFSHILLAEELWLKRIKQNAPEEQNFWEIIPMDKCNSLIEKNKNEWSEFLISQMPDVLVKKIPYVNSKGIKYENTLEEIFTHVINHSTYHRGQIASIVRELGGQPALTDYIVFARE